MDLKKILKITFCTILTSVICLYLGIVFLLPQIINSKTVINELELLINKKTGIETNIKGLKLAISPALVFDLNVESIYAKNNNTNVADIKNVSVSYKLLQNHLTLVSANSIYIDANILKQFKKAPTKKSKANFELNKLPEIHIQNLALNSDKLNLKARYKITKP